MKLHTEVGQVLVNQTFVGMVVSIGKQWFPAVGQRRNVDGEPVVLRSYVTSASAFVYAWLIVASITVPLYI